LAAVICVVPGCAGNFASDSAVVSSRMNSSWEKTTSGVFLVAGIVTGMISLASRPESRAAFACRCDRRAKASIASLDSSYRFASSMPTRSQALRMVIPSRSSVRRCDSALPYRANGVRTPPRT
jgi:hypothetical protein